MNVSYPLMLKLRMAEINRFIIPDFEDIWREYTNYKTSLKEEESWNITVENKDILRVQIDTAFHKGNNIPFKLSKINVKLMKLKLLSTYYVIE